MPKLSEILFGKSPSFKKLPTQSPDQQNLMAMLFQGLQGGQGPFADIYGQFDEGAFNKGVAEPELKRFREELLPSIMEKYIAGNQALGSGAQRAATRGASDLSSNLAQLLYNARQNQMQNRAQGINTFLGQQPFQYASKSGFSGLLPQLAQGTAQSFGPAIGSKLANMAIAG